MRSEYESSLRLQEQKEKKMNMQQRRVNSWRLVLLPLLVLTISMLVLAGYLGFSNTATAYAQSSGAVAFASSGHLIARTTVQITGTASCLLPENATLVESVGLNVEITQASGREIVQGVGGASLTMLCDGKVSPFQLFVTPSSGSAPFHGGSAIATGTLSVIWIDASGFFHADQISSGPEVIKITG